MSMRKRLVMGPHWALSLTTPALRIIFFASLLLPFDGSRRTLLAGSTATFRTSTVQRSRRRSTTASLGVARADFP